MIRRGAGFLALLLLAAPVQAQSRAGIYTVSGTEAGKGAFTGRVELRWTGSDYRYVREVEFTTWTHGGRPVSTVWTGTARDAGSAVELSFFLDRMGVVSQAPGLPDRTAADGVPMAIVGRFVTQGAGLAGAYRGQGAPFVEPTETWTPAGAPGASPIWSSQRVAAPSHRAPSALVKQLLFAAFNTFHQTSWVQPYLRRPELNAAIHYFVFDRTDFALHRRRPDLLRLINRITDAMNLEEAVVKANAFGKTLREKADAADLDARRFWDPAGAMGPLSNGQVLGDNDGALWTGVYAYTQSLRYKATGEQSARDNLERTVEGLLKHMQITGRSDEFARTLRTSTGALGTRWVAGTGPFTGIEWKIGGNNDMLKGILFGGLTAYEGLPAGHAARVPYGQALGALARNHPDLKGFRRGQNRMMAYGLSGLLTGSSSDEREYKKLARNPFYMLYNLATAGGIHYQGISDWSGTHLEICSLITQLRLADHHGEWLAEIVNKVAMRRGAKRLAPIRRVLLTLAAGGSMAKIPLFSSIDPTDGVWALREIPWPRPRLGFEPSLRADYSLSPYPNLPWKLDWTTDRGRAQSYLARPFFEQGLSNYVWKNNPLQGLHRRGSSSTSHENNGVDYLFGYWLARAYGVIGPND